MFSLLVYLSTLSLALGNSGGGGGDEGRLDSWIYLSSEVSIPRVGFGSCGLRNTAEMTCASLKNGVKMIDSAQARGR